MHRRNLFLMPFAILIIGLFLSTSLQSEEPPAAAGPSLQPIATDAPVPEGKSTPEENIRQRIG